MMVFDAIVVGGVDVATGSSTDWVSAGSPAGPVSGGSLRAGVHARRTGTTTVNAPRTVMRRRAELFAAPDEGEAIVGEAEEVMPDTHSTRTLSQVPNGVRKPHLLHGMTHRLPQLLDVIRSHVGAAWR